MGEAMDQMVETKNAEYPIQDPKLNLKVLKKNKLCDSVGDSSLLAWLLLLRVGERDVYDLRHTRRRDAKPGREKGSEPERLLRDKLAGSLF